MRLQPGLLGNPQSAAFCTQAQFQADSCPADSTVGSVAITALAYAAADDRRAHEQQRRRLQHEAHRQRAGARRHRRRGRGRPVEALPPGAGLRAARARRLRARVDVRRPAPHRGRSGADHEDRADVQREGQQGRVHAHADVVRRGQLAQPRKLLGGPERLLSEGVQDDADRLQLAGVLAERGGLDGCAGRHERTRVPAGEHHAQVRPRGGRAEARRGDPAARRSGRTSPERSARARVPRRTRAAAPRARAWAPRSSTRRCSRRRCADPSTSPSTPRTRCRACWSCCPSRSACGWTAWSSRSSRGPGTPSPRIPTCRCAASRSRSTAGGPTRR